MSEVKTSFFLKAVEDVFSWRALALDPGALYAAAHSAPHSPAQRKKRLSWLIWPPTVLSFIVLGAMVMSPPGSNAPYSVVGVTVPFSYPIFFVIAMLSLVVVLAIWIKLPRIQVRQWDTLVLSTVDELPPAVQADFNRLLREHPSPDYRVELYSFKRYKRKRGQIAFIVLRQRRQWVVLDVDPTLPA